MTEIHNSEDKPSSAITVAEVTLVTPTNQAIYEAGKSMLIESVSTGREFCKFMIGTSTSAIPVYLALIKFILPEKYVPSLKVGIVALTPSVIFLLAAIIFLVGYFPQQGIASLDIPEEIEKERRKSVQRRHRLSIAGFSVFCIAVLTGLIVIGFMLRIPDRLQNHDIQKKNTEHVNQGDGE